MKKTISIYIPHYGCPNDCIFCNQIKITGVKNPANYDSIKRQIEEEYEYMRDLDTVEIAFFGGSFTALPLEVQEKSLSIARDFLNSIENKGEIKLSTRPDAIDEHILDMLEHFGVNSIELGVQSMDDEVLRKANRGHDSKSVIDASSLIKKRNFVLGHQIMVGLPGDNEERLMVTAEKIIRLKPEIIRIYPVLVIENTELENMYKIGKYEPVSVEEALRLSKILYKKFTRENINVIRIGLQNSKEIDPSASVVSGPFHEAFGELVLSEIFRDKIEEEIVNFDFPQKNIEIRANKSDISKISGHRKSNKTYFKKKYSLDLKIIPDSDVELNSMVIFGKTHYLK